MPITQVEFETLISDLSKCIETDIRWTDDEDHSPAVQFRAEVRSDPGYPIFVNGRFNALAGTLSFTLVHRTTGRIYGLDLGADHHNPTCNCVGEKHKHRWSDAWKDKDAYVPDDITAGVDAVRDVWRQFCDEAKITHRGRFDDPPFTSLADAGL
ncbi:MAG: hypothetical protein IT457_07805 [Planctomycetes bacterium]|nr:hypothetical protein [Planctomycetota bacterium]